MKFRYQWKRLFGDLEAASPAELAKMLQRLHREQGFLENVLNTLQEGVLVLDITGAVIYSNGAAARLLGATIDVIEQAPLKKIAPDLARALFTDQPVALAEDKGLAVQELELFYPEHRYLRLYISHLQDLEDPRQEPYTALVLNDITQEKAQAEALLEEEKLASVMMLAGGVAHEIGNPLNALTIHLGLIERCLKKTEKTDEQLQSSVKICQEEVQRLDDIIRHFLKALKPVKPDLQSLDIAPFLIEVLAVQKAQMEGLGVSVELELAEPLPTVVGDPALLKQVFFNLIKNALEAMDRGGKLILRARFNDEFVFIDIEDTGVGIEVEALSQLFTPFYTTKNYGHGLGLVLVQRILRAHGGSLNVRSRPGEGTCFTLQLPQKYKRVRLLA